MYTLVEMSFHTIKMFYLQNVVERLHVVSPPRQSGIANVMFQYGPCPAQEILPNAMISPIMPDKSTQTINYFIGA